VGELPNSRKRDIKTRKFLGEKVDMVKIIFEHTQPTIDAMLVTISNRKKQPPRRYLGASSLGQECERALWYSFRHTNDTEIPAANLLAIEDGFEQEKVAIKRLRAIKGIKLLTGSAKKQIGFVSHDGHYKGHVDGIITGILESPATPHIWEHKSVNLKKFASLRKIITQNEEKKCLQLWDATYFAQAQIYMDKMGLTRHFLTVSSPGGRDYISLRTEIDQIVCDRLEKKATRIIDAPSPPPRAFLSPNYICNWCPHSNTCWSGEKIKANKNCRTCLSSTPHKNGAFVCELKKITIGPRLEKKGCGEHLFIPDLFKEYEQTAVEMHSKDGSVKSILYRDKMGRVVANGKGSGVLSEV